MNDLCCFCIRSWFVYHHLLTLTKIQTCVYLSYAMICYQTLLYSCVSKCSGSAHHHHLFKLTLVHLCPNSANFCIQWLHTSYHFKVLQFCTVYFFSSLTSLKDPWFCSLEIGIIRKCYYNQDILTPGMFSATRILLLLGHHSWQKSILTREWVDERLEIDRQIDGFIHKHFHILYFYQFQPLNIYQLNISWYK